MRSRYSAFAMGLPDYLLRTWHPDTRPNELELDAAQRWLRLDVLGVYGGGLLDAEGTVDFQAHYRRTGVTTSRGMQSEVSTFRREGSEWRYYDGVRSLR
ncbi:YchJ family metal-binding protein [Jatrophihabitans telluris]|uniref:YchJ family metal-binding protein n=2 Tax=Jatrophihabitans telluris TaxID=2038343 RepID=A0ABY4QX27_9ACTN|nr:YchJ family metal-binding protein [Jatrophihabitans telluris]